jgi:hypothetical protein
MSQDASTRLKFRSPQTNSIMQPYQYFQVTMLVHVLILFKKLKINKCPCDLKKTLHVVSRHMPFLDSMMWCFPMNAIVFHFPNLCAEFHWCLCLSTHKFEVHTLFQPPSTYFSLQTNTHAYINPATALLLMPYWLQQHTRCHHRHIKQVAG